MKPIQLRTLIIDDDRLALDRIASEVRGEFVVLDGRRVEPTVSTLLVEVEMVQDLYQFTADTLMRLADSASQRWDLVVMDYSFASADIQPRQWGEDGGLRLDTNDHLLTIVDLRKQAESAPILGAAERGRITGFFERPCDLVLRSFQHDRVMDKLGSYESRFNHTQGTFPKAMILRLDSFAMIYGSDPDLRSEFYLSSKRGREFYRNIVTQMTILHVRAALTRRLAKSNRRIAVPRSTAILALITSVIAAVSAILAAMIPDVVAAITRDDFGLAVRLLVVTVIATVVCTWLLTLVLDRSIRELFDWSQS